MSTDNNQGNERIDRLEDIIQRHDMQMEMIQATQGDQTAAIQRHDMFLEMLRAAQEMYQATHQELAESHRRHEETQREQTASIQRHNMEMEMLRAAHSIVIAVQERQEENQNLMINLLQTFSTMLHRVMDTQQEHGHAIRGLEENRDNSP